MNLKNYGIEVEIKDPILRGSLIDFLEGKQLRVSYLDCLANELQSAINANVRVGWLSPEQAQQLEEAVGL